MEEKRRYLMVLAKSANNYSAYVPDVPGCITVGDTVEETQANMREALSLHFDGLHADGDPIPAPEMESCYVELEWTPSPLNPPENDHALYGLEEEPHEELYALVDRLDESQVPIVVAFLESLLERSKAEGEGQKKEP